MSPAPSNPKIYHITHVSNLRRIIEMGMFLSDAKRIERELDCELIGMSTIKRRRLEELEVGCHAGTKVGDYVPFYFCPRSIMLYILHMGNNPDLTYHGGQRPILHLEADLPTVLRWAQRKDIRWAISDRNAGAYFAQFFADPQVLDNLDWNAIAATDFRDMRVKEAKQAEFLIHESFPWDLIEEVGVFDGTIAAQVRDTLTASRHQPRISVQQAWYF
jgi:hypothetical protein